MAFLPYRTYFCIYSFSKKSIFFFVSGFVIYFNCFIFRAEWVKMKGKICKRKGIGKLLSKNVEKEQKACKMFRYRRKNECVYWLFFFLIIALNFSGSISNKLHLTILIFIWFGWLWKKTTKRFQWYIQWGFNVSDQRLYFVSYKVVHIWI